jgi:hypothetical protein
MTHSGGMAASDQQQNRFASGASHEQGARPELTRQLAQRFPGLRDHIAAQHNANWHNDWDRRHVHFDHGRFFVFADGFWCGLDDGFFPWDYLPYYPDDYYPYDYYTNTDPPITTETLMTLDSGDSATVRLSRRSCSIWAITVALLTAFWGRPLVMRWRSTKSRITLP